MSLCHHSRFRHLLHPIRRSLTQTSTQTSATPQLPATIDLRSDTVTLPSAAMLSAINTAKLGDDVFGEDPTVTHLERTAAQIFGKEKGLFLRKYG
mmetsp:Transcript_19969/g.39845  ORF Transcript_19969/g.39845 Transcript_19969/m.39845 type:complete len:95 (+) Transcript_19969:134-418(+)